MYTTTIGRTFLKAYNERFEKNYTARSFFEEVFIPLFFDHTKYMMPGGNSPLENSFGSVPKRASSIDMILGKKPFETPTRIKERIDELLNKIETKKADASIAIGYGVLDNSSATASQTTSIEFPDNKEDIYFSWIGAGLGIGVEGGVTILFDNAQLLLDIYSGWTHYRKYLENNNLMKGNQINTWNGHWISHLYDEYDYDETDPTVGLNPLEKTNEGLLNIPTIIWVKVLLGISSHFKGNNLVGYLYNIGQTNTTIGFIPFKLEDISRPNLFYKKIFGDDVFKQDIKQVEQLYGTAFGIRAACQYGSIGVQALEPKGLRNFMPTGNGGKKISQQESDNNQRITFNTYLIWILAMLNNEKLWEESQQIAKLLLSYEAGAGKAKKDRTNNVNQLLDSTSTKLFLQNMIPIIEDEVKDGKNVSAYEALGKTINSMPKDNFPYFNTLIRFQYALSNK